MKYTWKASGDGQYTANPYDGRFHLDVSREKSGQWRYFVNSDPSEDDFASKLAAMHAAEEAYDSYYIDFDEIGDGS